MPEPVIRCTQCGQAYPEIGIPYLCPACGGVYDYDAPFSFSPYALDAAQPGLWQYRAAFALPEQAPVVCLGEGNTPLLPVHGQEGEVWLKMESQNPTGSYKDRGSATLLSHLRVRGATAALEDSSGNAGASFAAYAARAGVAARVFVPESAAGPKRGQIEAYGADLVRVPGPRSAAAEAVLKEAQAGGVYASHAYLPFGLAGIATIAYELWAQLGREPGTVIAPVGHGGLLLGIVRGFQALKHSGVIAREPYYVGVQAKNCAPVWAGFSAGAAAMQNAEEGPTVAEGVRVRTPVRAAALLKEIPAGTGTFIAIAEEEILPAYRDLARWGIHVEPTSALAWRAYTERIGSIPEPIILIMSGSGLKYGGAGK